MDRNKWLQEEVKKGLQLLASAGLPGRPGQYTRSREEALAQAKAAARAWVIALECEYSSLSVLDLREESRRFDVAFRRLLRRCKEWPSPADLIEELRGMEARKHVEKLPEPPPTEEQLKVGRAALAKIQDMLTGKFAIH